LLVEVRSNDGGLKVAYSLFDVTFKLLLDGVLLNVVNYSNTQSLLDWVNN
jgi:hypothetical protein